MALPHAILVSLCEQSGSGYELARRFDRVLRILEVSGLVEVLKTYPTVDEAVTADSTPATS